LAVAAARFSDLVPVLNGDYEWLVIDLADNE
jgi:hypothetical protein